ncbi:MAG: hypothetical protein C0622_01775 [Desulfuromonas sp.]|mgnify:CR=1 FL=1|nr:MAG: hypothetical protein C0622_01775 [Desulfuromonas sp.]
MRRWLKITLITAAVIFALLLLSMLIVPWQIKKQGSAWIAENTTRTLTIEKAYFNPFALTVQLGGVALTEQGSSEPFVSFDRLKVSVAYRSLIDQALILDRVELDNPFVNIELLDKQLFNFSDFTQLGGDEPQAEPVPPGESDPFLFSLNNIIIVGGAVDFTDQTSEKKSQHQIRELELKVPFVGNIPYLTNQYVHPYLRMLLNGSEFEAKGQTKPFSDSMETSLNLTLDKVDLAFYAYHSPVPLPIDVKQGVLYCNLDLGYRVSATSDPVLKVGGEVTISDVDLRELDGRELFRLAGLSVDIDWAELFAQDFNLVSIALDDPEIFVDRDAGGRWNFERIQEHLGAGPAAEPVVNEEPAEPESESESEAAGGLPLLFVEKLLLNNGRVHFRDDFVAGGFSEEIDAINLQLDGLSTHLDQQTGLAFTLHSGRELGLALNGTLALNPVSATVDAAADNLLLAPLYPYLEPFLTAPVAGTLGVGGQILYTPDGNLLLQGGRLGLKDLAVPFAGKDQFSLAALDIGDVTLDLNQQQVVVGSVRLADGAVSATVLADGSLSPLALIKEQPQAADDPGAETAADAGETTPWSVRVDNFDLENLALNYSDLSQAKKPGVKIPRLALHAENLSYPVAAESPFTLDAQIGKKGAVDIAGTVVHTPLKLQAKTKISNIHLADYDAFIPESVRLSLRSGSFYTSATVALEQRDGELSGNFSADTLISNFSLREPQGDADLLAWESLNLNGMSGEISPFSLHVKEVALSKYRANIEVSKDGSVNLARVASAEEESPAADGEAVAEEAPEAPPVAATEVEEPAAPDIRIDALTLQGGTVAFVDRSMDTLFSATMYELGGRVTGMASDPEMQADVDLRGQLENHSPLTITGKLNPLSGDLFADLVISFKDIDLTPMTPYSGTYIGYAIGKGKLYLDLTYRIEQRKIKAANKILIDQFTLGDKVESEKAVSLPIGLAIALLKDSNGEIHLDVPISGDLDDPDFSVAGVVFTVIKNLIVKAATAPFSLLSAMLGGGDEDFTSVTFAPGLAVIDAAQQEKLQGLADMLAKRPSLNLEISAFVDPNQDPENYRQEQLRQMLVEAKWLELQDKGKAPESRDAIVISDEEYPELILTVYENADFPRPRNFIGMLKKLPVEEMEKLLLANILAGEEQMIELAKARAQAVRDVLEAANGEIKPRLFLIQNDINLAPEEGAASRVEFKISVK